MAAAIPPTKAGMATAIGKPFFSVVSGPVLTPDGAEDATTEMVVTCCLTTSLVWVGRSLGTGAGVMRGAAGIILSVTENRLASVIHVDEGDDQVIVSRDGLTVGIFVPDQSKEWIRHEKRDLSKGDIDEGTYKSGDDLRDGLRGGLRVVERFAGIHLPVADNEIGQSREDRSVRQM